MSVFEYYSKIWIFTFKNLNFTQFQYVLFVWTQDLHITERIVVIYTIHLLWVNCFVEFLKQTKYLVTYFPIFCNEHWQLEGRPGTVVSAFDLQLMDAFQENSNPSSVWRLLFSPGARNISWIAGYTIKLKYISINYPG